LFELNKWIATTDKESTQATEDHRHYLEVYGSTWSRHRTMRQHLLTGWALTSLHILLLNLLL